MPIVPMKQTVSIKRKGIFVVESFTVTSVSEEVDYDGWGEPLYGQTITVKARVAEQTKVVTNQTGQEAVTTLTIYFDKLPDIMYDDVISYTNELGVTVERVPVRIEVRRGLSGKPLLTEVYV